MAHAETVDPITTTSPLSVVEEFPEAYIRGSDGGFQLPDSGGGTTIPDHQELTVSIVSITSPDARCSVRFASDLRLSRQDELWERAQPPPAPRTSEPPPLVNTLRITRDAPHALSPESPSSIWAKVVRYENHFSDDLKDETGRTDAVEYLAEHTLALAREPVFDYTPATGNTPREEQPLGHITIRSTTDNKEIDSTAAEVKVHPHLPELARQAIWAVENRYRYEGDRSETVAAAYNLSQYHREDPQDYAVFRERVAARAVELAYRQAVVESVRETTTEHVNR